MPEIAAVLVGQCDGKAFIPREAVLAIGRKNLHIEESPAKDGWYVWLSAQMEIPSPTCDA